MKKKIMIVMVIGFVLMASFPGSSYAHGRQRDYRGGNWALPLVGGLLAGAVIGSVLAQPHYAAPQRAYAYAPPARVYSRPAYVDEAPPGTWVVVPGRWVQGRWVPPHRAWLPVNPY